MSKIPQIGETFEMTLDNFSGFKATMKVVDDNVKGDSGGTIKVQTLIDSQKSEIHDGYASYNEYDGKDKPERFMVIEEEWFTANDKRKIKIL